MNGAASQKSKKVVIGGLALDPWWWQLRYSAAGVFQYLRKYFSQSSEVLVVIVPVWLGTVVVGDGTIAQRVLAATDGTDRVDFIFNRFVSAIKYDTVLQGATNFANSIDAVTEGAELPKPICDYELEPEVLDESLVNMYEYGVALKVYASALQNATSEQSSRMQAMDNASKNAGEMIDKLTIQFNRARQARITTELIEIISGAESLKG